MAAIRLDKMTAQALRKADAEGHLNLGTPADRLKVVSYVNEGVSRLHDLLADTFVDYQLTGATQVAVNGTWVAPTVGAKLTLNLTPPVLRVRAVHFLGTSGTDSPVDVPIVPFPDRISAKNGRRVCSFFNELPLTDPGIMSLAPPEDAAGTYQLWYTPAFVPLVNDADTYQTVSNWEELAELWAAIQIRHDMEGDTSVLERRHEKLEDQIRDTASKRQASGPRKVRKVRKTMGEALLDEWEWLPR